MARVKAPIKFNPHFGVDFEFDEAELQADFDARVAGAARQVEGVLMAEEETLP